ncbi:uncharacterized protein [Clytia hemisphaerica]|uniref:ZP domain-containing protein n=1 Tax=Clytia hemisphaerica TaxID=252671 RepID=A0A7M5XAF0_9CNID
MTILTKSLTWACLLAFSITLTSAVFTPIYRGGAVKFLWRGNLNYEIIHYTIQPGHLPIPGHTDGVFAQPEFLIRYYSNDSTSFDGTYDFTHRNVSVGGQSVDEHYPWIASAMRVTQAANLVTDGTDSYKYYGIFLNDTGAIEPYPFVNPPDGPVYLFTRMHQKVREDTSEYNSSPESLYVVAPYHHFVAGCNYTINVPTMDQDMDFVKCRLAETEEEGKSFAPNMSNIHVTKDCQLLINTFGLQNGTYSIALLLEDYTDLNDLNSTLSYASVQFLYTISTPPVTGNACYKPIIPTAFVQEENEINCEKPDLVSLFDAFFSKPTALLNQTIVALALESDPIVSFEGVFKQLISINGNITSSPNYGNLPTAPSGYLYYIAEYIWFPNTQVSYGESSMCFVAIAQSGLSSEQGCVQKLLEQVEGDTDLIFTSIDVTNNTRYFYEFSFDVKATYFELKEEQAIFELSKNGISTHNITLSMMTWSLNLTARSLRFTLKEAILLDAGVEYTMSHQRGFIKSQNQCKRNGAGTTAFITGLSIDQTMQINPISPTHNSISPDTLTSFTFSVSTSESLTVTTKSTIKFEIRKSSDDSLVYTVPMDSCNGASCTFTGSSLTLSLPVTFNWENGTSYYVTLDAGAYQNKKTGVETMEILKNTWNFTIIFSKDSYRYYTECNLDSMVMYINKTFIPLLTTTTQFVASWNDPSCQGTDDGDVLTLSTGYSSCGMKLIQTDNNVIFQNTAKVTNGKTSTSEIDKAVTFTKHTIQCVKAKKVNVTFTNAVNVTEVNTVFANHSTIGTFSLAMELHPDNKYTGPVNFPAVVSLGERFNLALKVEGGGSTNLSVVPQQCFATPDVNMLNPIREEIVVDRCPVSDYGFQVEDASSGLFRFSFDTFRFKSNNGMVYIHCSTVVCITGIDDAECQFGCSGNRRKRSVGEKHRSRRDEEDVVTTGSGSSGISDVYALRTGMIVIIDQRENSNKDSQKDGFFESTPNQILSILFLLTILIAILWFVIRRYRNKEKAPIATEGVVNVKKHAEA